MNGCSGENIFDILAPDRITTSSVICLLFFFVVRIYSWVNVASFNARRLSGSPTFSVWNEKTKYIRLAYVCMKYFFDIFIRIFFDRYIIDFSKLYAMLLFFHVINMQNLQLNVNCNKVFLKFIVSLFRHFDLASHPPVLKLSCYLLWSLFLLNY